MDRLNEMEAFVSVVDQGGFTGAARKMGVSKSAVSKHVAALEARLGARLLDRTTRRVNPTEIGLAYYDRAKDVIAGAGEADDLVSAMQGTPRGALRISVPVSFAITQISELIGPFLARYPEISINMVLNDRFVEILSENFDLAIRIGQLEDSSLMVRKLAECRTMLVAAPGYLEKNGTPERLEDLTEHDLLHYSNLSTGNSWRFSPKNGDERHVRVGGRLTANNGDILLRAAEDGLGIARMPTFLVGDRVRNGDLIEVMKDIPGDTLGIHAVYPPGRFVQPKLSVFIDYLAEAFRGRSVDDWD